MSEFTVHISCLDHKIPATDETGTRVATFYAEDVTPFYPKLLP